MKNTHVHNPIRKTIIGLSIIGVFFLVLLLRGNSITAPFERDEGEYAYSARILLRGGVPYEETFIQKPPLIMYTYAIGQLFDPRGVVAPRILAILFILGTIYLIGYITHKEYGWLAGVAGMWIITPMLSFPYLAALAANTEIFMLLPLVATVALYVRAKSDPHTSLLYMIFASSIATVAILYKPIAIFPLSLLFVVWFVNIAVKTKNMRTMFFVILSWITGFVVSAALFLGYFFIRGAGKAFWEVVIDFNRFYVSFFGFGFEYVLQRFMTFLIKWTPLCLLFVVAIVMQLKKSLLYLGLFCISLLGVFQTPIGHYYLLLVPFWAILSAGAVVALGSYIEEKSELFIILLITCIVVIYMLLGVGEQFSKTPPEMSQWIYGQGNPFIESSMMSEQLAQITTKSDYVFVAGSEPQILYYADRKSSSRFVITYPFVIQTPMQLSYQQEAIRDIENRRPKAIVLSQRAESGLWDEKSPQVFRNFLTEYLRTKYSLVGATVWNADSVVWKSQLSEYDMANASLLLFSLKTN